MDIEFVKNIRQTHCKGCLNGGRCTNCETLNCWLRHTYLPNGIWEQAAMQDVENDLGNNLTDTINKEIIKQMAKKRKNSAEIYNL